MSLADSRALLTLVLDALIPPEGGFPGAGAIALDHVLGVAAASCELDARLSEGLGAIGDATRVVGAGDFAALDADAREAVLRQVERAHPDFFDALVRHTYAGYYSHPTVVTRLGLTAGPVHPRGHHIPPSDLPDLTHITARAPLYRLP